MAMDVVSGESSGNFGQLLLLYPLLFWLQGLQVHYFSLRFHFPGRSGTGCFGNKIDLPPQPKVFKGFGL